MGVLAEHFISDLRENTSQAARKWPETSVSAASVPQISGGEQNSGGKEQSGIRGSSCEESDVRLES